MSTQHAQLNIIQVGPSSVPTKCGLWLALLQKPVCYQGVEQNKTLISEKFEMEEQNSYATC